jgi:hypothetical protein
MPDFWDLLESATGPSRKLDRAACKALGVPNRNYSSSVDACLELIHERLPAAHWHVGRAEDGVSVYATLSNGRHREESTKVTVPLALLTVTARFLDSQAGQ